MPLNQREGFGRSRIRNADKPQKTRILANAATGSCCSRIGNAGRPQKTRILANAATGALLQNPAR
jgi:hypothetical protein